MASSGSEWEVLKAGLSLKKHHMCGCRTPKQRSVVIVCDLELHTTILWRVISMKLNIDKKITGLEIMPLNLEKT